MPCAQFINRNEKRGREPKKVFLIEKREHNIVLIRKSYKIHKFRKQTEYYVKPWVHRNHCKYYCRWVPLSGWHEKSSFLVFDTNNISMHECVLFRWLFDVKSLAAFNLRSMSYSRFSVVSTSWICSFCNRIRISKFLFQLFSYLFKSI